MEDLFNYYHLNKYGFFFEYDAEQDDCIDIPLIIDERLAKTLGMTVDEISAMDHDTAMKWSDKYPIIQYCIGYYLLCLRSA